MQRCALCQVHTKSSLCEGCQSLIHAPENPCQICAKPLHLSDHISDFQRSRKINADQNNSGDASFLRLDERGEARHLICGECRSDEPAFNQTICAAIYQPPVSVWVKQLKFGGRLDRARIMAEALANQLHEIDASVPILPVPLHRQRLLTRGYNQAYEVAKIIATIQHRKILSQHLVRTKNTAMQAELHEKQRSANVRAAFKVTQRIDAPVVLVLDDVMTTGQTMRSVAKCLIGSGVKQVIAVVFARSGS